MNPIQNADLHCHSTVSDGTLTPEALAARAAANGVELWALTDHDEIGGQHRAAAAAHEQGMRYLTGTEISVTFVGQTVHIVGLGFDADDAALRDGLRVPEHIVLQELLALHGSALLATTLIAPGDKHPMNDAGEIRERLEKLIAGVIDAGACPQEPTTVIDLTAPEPVLIRQGRGDLARLGL